MDSALTNKNAISCKSMVRALGRAFHGHQVFGNRDEGFVLVNESRFDVLEAYLVGLPRNCVLVFVEFVSASLGNEVRRTWVFGVGQDLHRGEVQVARTVFGFGGSDVDEVHDNGWGLRYVWA